jgi:hypothetical protein
VRIGASAAVVVLAAVACGGVDPSPANSVYVVTVHVDGPGRLISLPPAIDCPGTCSAAFAGVSWITLAAISGDDASFVEWSRGCSGATGCAFVPTRGVDIVARFEPLRTAQKK